MQMLRPSRKRQYTTSGLNDSSDDTDHTHSNVDDAPNRIPSNDSDSSEPRHSMAQNPQGLTLSPLKRQAKHSGTKPSLQIMPLQKCKSYNKKQYCFYCFKPYSKMARHLELVHCNEMEVAKAVCFPKRSKERQIQLNLLRKRGNFAHNADVVRKGYGEMIACYRPKESKEAKDFIHCCHCQGLYNKRSLWKHVRNCPLKPKMDGESQGRKGVRSMCALTTPVGLEISDGMKKVLRQMNYDEVSRIVQSDKCIMQLGQHMFNRMGSDVGKHDYIRQKMREAGRLLLEARKITPIKAMEEMIIPSNFPHVISAMKVVAGYNAENNSFRIPSLALKLGHSIQKICSIVESNSMMNGDHQLADYARDFRKTHQAKWNEFISAGAITTFKEANWTIPQVIPLTQEERSVRQDGASRQEEAAPPAPVLLQRRSLRQSQRVPPHPLGCP
ncbi:uncharacterized protein LOC105029909 isoform X2 [Esox lucius]|nr:uncharacterized protein LOC105029909 isoform X2 [Esox lucius]XP_019906140.1 uncharacterized protein LOC105029909 isoform X2 [Esox lucius]